MSERRVYADNCHRQGVQAHEIAALRAQLAAVEREVFDYQQREKAWNELEALKDAVRWFEEAKKANYALAAARVAEERERCARIAVETLRRMPDLVVTSNMWISAGGTRVEGGLNREAAITEVAAALRAPDGAQP